MSIELTKDADALICLLYKHYRQQLKNGVSKLQSKMLGSAAVIQSSIAPKWTVDDTNEVLRELHRAELIGCQYGDGIVTRCHLSTDGIIYMENRFKNSVDNVLDYLVKIADILPI